MRIERVSAPLAVPRWAVLIVVTYLILVGAGVYLERATGADAWGPCVFREVTGQPCPGCGTTHMVLAAGRGQLGRAFDANPLVFGLCVLGLCLLILRFGFGCRVIWITSAASRRVFVLVLLLLVVGNWLYLLVAA